MKREASIIIKYHSSHFFFFVLSRSLAYNNLDTLPKDLFKGLEALTKV